MNHNIRQDSGSFDHNEKVGREGASYPFIGRTRTTTEIVSDAFPFEEERPFDGAFSGGGGIQTLEALGSITIIWDASQKCPRFTR